MQLLNFSLLSLTDKATECQIITLTTALRVVGLLGILFLILHVGKFAL